jgi:hypothetical protein
MKEDKNASRDQGTKSSGTQKAILAAGATGCGTLIAGCGILIGGAILFFGVALAVFSSTASNPAQSNPRPNITAPKLNLRTPAPVPTDPPLLAAHDLAILHANWPLPEDHETVAQFDKALDMFQARHPGDSKHIIRMNLHAAFNRCENELGSRPDLIQLTLIALEIDRSGTQPYIQGVMREAAKEYIRRSR